MFLSHVFLVYDCDRGEEEEPETANALDEIARNNVRGRKAFCVAFEVSATWHQQRGTRSTVQRFESKMPLLMLFSTC